MGVNEILGLGDRAGAEAAAGGVDAGVVGGDRVGTGEGEGTGMGEGEGTDGELWAGVGAGVDEDGDGVGPLGPPVNTATSDPEACVLMTLLHGSTQVLVQYMC